MRIHEDFVKVVHSHAAVAFDRQLLLAELVTDLDWSFDLQAGRLAFGEKYCYQAEVLGTESDESGTWLWAWANQVSDIPPERQAASLSLRGLGEARGIVEMTEPMVALGHADGHAFASIAVGEGFGKAYYRGPYRGGAVVLLITDPQLQWPIDDPLSRIVSVFPQAISAPGATSLKESCGSRGVGARYERGVLGSC